MSGSAAMPRNIFLVFLAVGIAVAGGSIAYYVSDWMRAKEGRTWPTAEARILTIGVEEHSSRTSDGDTSITWYPRIAYAYRVGNRTLRGERIWLTGNQFYNDRADAVAFVQDYAVGETVPVVYDPARPGQSAMLVENPPWQILIFTAVGLAWIALTFNFRPGRREPPRESFGECRSCRTRLSFAEHGGTAGRDCPRCGARGPLATWRDKAPIILFLAVFAGIWAVGLYLVFLA